MPSNKIWNSKKFWVDAIAQYQQSFKHFAEGKIKIIKITNDCLAILNALLEMSLHHVVGYEIITVKSKRRKPH